MSKSAKSLGLLFRKHREEFMATVRFVGDATGIDHSVISRIERGQNKISLENAIRLCEHYGIPISRLPGYTVRNKAGQII